MKALVLEKPGAFAWTDAAEPTPAANEVLVRVRRGGVAASFLRHKGERGGEGGRGLGNYRVLTVVVLVVFVSLYVIFR